MNSLIRLKSAEHSVQKCLAGSSSGPGLRNINSESNKAAAAKSPGQGRDHRRRGPSGSNLHRENRELRQHREPSPADWSCAASTKDGQARLENHPDPGRVLRD
ncbi:hypothetical protein KQX54_004625 [Cotesia glomerata]|uniref:Uncharacterized protein n=1 Tax=Cotesia glomerata TaxID=32391 RepID=A0AAV7HSB5_COTGL|nr:hypothetical protein KQX54_004625 [Cotesia glomerata]